MTTAEHRALIASSMAILHRESLLSELRVVWKKVKAAKLGYNLLLLPHFVLLQYLRGDARSEKNYQLNDTDNGANYHFPDFDQYPLILLFYHCFEMDKFYCTFIWNSCANSLRVRVDNNVGEHKGARLHLLLASLHPSFLSRGVNFAGRNRARVVYNFPMLPIISAPEIEIYGRI